MYTIQDWAGNTKFNGKHFKSFDDGEEFLCEYFETKNMDYEEWRSEYYIELVDT